jgi:hypothetical protein
MFCRIQSYKAVPVDSARGTQSLRRERATFTMMMHGRTRLEKERKDRWAWAVDRRARLRAARARCCASGLSESPFFGKHFIDQNNPTRHTAGPLSGLHRKKNSDPTLWHSKRRVRPSLNHFTRLPRRPLSEVVETYASLTKGHGFESCAV